MYERYQKAEAFITQWYWRHERQLSWVGLTLGFIFESTQLKRVDQLLENLWVVGHILIALFGIVAINYVENFNARGSFTQKVYHRLHFWLVMTIQFAFGGLFSAFFFLYIQSGTLATSWPFFVLLAGMLIANEVYKFHYHRLVFQITVLFLALFSFAIYIVPVVTRSISDGMFLLSGVVSLIFLSGVIALLWFISKERFKKNRRILVSTISATFVLINIFYFTNIIPPLPLLVKDAQAYHFINATGDGTYTALAEEEQGFRFISWKQVIHKKDIDPVFVWSAVFSPTQFNTSIVHQWQFLNEGNWQTEETIMLPIVGGRDGGYRTYSKKTFAQVGEWRVNITTQSGQIIGRVRFEIKTVDNVPPLVERIL
jgi:hypothetical protein